MLGQKYTSKDERSTQVEHITVQVQCKCKNQAIVAISTVLITTVGSTAEANIVNHTEASKHSKSQ